ncbi:MAG: ABC transporter ATP-binding protein [Spirochaetales bacterium]|nr:ABC transporter ATP-binding protein [Spirochaetales bacterium]
MIRMSGVAFAYGNKPLFKGLGLELAPGNMYGLLGKNGAGKTTLLKILTGVLHTDAGQCEVFGENPASRPPTLLRELFFIPEDFSVPAMRLDAFVSLYAPFYPRFDREAFDDCVREFELGPRDKLTALSFGQKKKLLIAFGLASNCRLLVLDEPTNGLDIPSKRRFRKLVAGALTEDKSFIISTHQVRDLETLIDPVVILDEGRIIFNRPLADISRRLTVSFAKDEPDPDRVVYSERVLGGYTVLEENPDGRETNIDLELLFNAVVNGREKIARLMESEASHEQHDS